MLTEDQVLNRFELLSFSNAHRSDGSYKKTIHYKAKLAHAKNNILNKNVICLEDFRSDIGKNLEPKHTENIARITGIRLKASDGKLYPRPSKSARSCAQVARDERNQYHRITKQSDTLLFALCALDSSWDPAELAVHMKKHAEVGKKLDLILQWLIAFSAEFHERGTTSR